ncbi:TM2 domain-containing protein 3 isoform X2 [Narcine bancroftii]|uniref:TM2 domain-containing protein 3 isoform X2 n=1 Tax=Narcine bancroftii TaxID=1343680 RepID=UPI003831C62F
MAPRSVRRPLLWLLLGLAAADSPSTGAPDGLARSGGTGLPLTSGPGSSSSGGRPPELPESAASSPPPHLAQCPSAGHCSRLPPVCLDCLMHHNCVYGKEASFNCSVKPDVQCVDENKIEQKTLQITFICQFCWQLPTTQYHCKETTKCKTVRCPREYFISNCTALEHVHCLGNRTFQKKVYCNWTGGYKWSTALALSSPPKNRKYPGFQNSSKWQKKHHIGRVWS